MKKIHPDPYRVILVICELIVFPLEFTGVLSASVHAGWLKVPAQRASPNRGIVLSHSSRSLPLTSFVTGPVQPVRASLMCGLGAPALRRRRVCGGWVPSRPFLCCRRLARCCLHAVFHPPHVVVLGGEFDDVGPPMGTKSVSYPLHGTSPVFRPLVPTGPTSCWQGGRVERENTTGPTWGSAMRTAWDVQLG